MNYFIVRDGQQYGPYTLADLQRYTASGNIALTDLCTSEGQSEPVPVSQIIGTIAVPPSGFTPAPVISSGTPYSSQYPDPPNLHWGLVLLFGVLSCGLFFWIWMIVQAVWLKKIVPQSRALYFYAGALIIIVAVFIVSFMAGLHHQAGSPISSLLNIVYFVLLELGYFNFKDGFEQHYNSEEPMGLQLSGVMTFFFALFYFQYHMSDIVRRKHADRLYESGR